MYKQSLLFPVVIVTEMTGKTKLITGSNWSAIITDTVSVNPTTAVLHSNY